jgi:hypothetical protein
MRITVSQRVDQRDRPGIVDQVLIRRCHRVCSLHTALESSGLRTRTLRSRRSWRARVQAACHRERCAVSPLPRCGPRVSQCAMQPWSRGNYAQRMILCPHAYARLLDGVAGRPPVEHHGCPNGQKTLTMRHSAGIAGVFPLLLP